MDHGWDDDRQCDGARFMCFCWACLVPALCVFEQSSHRFPPQSDAGRFRGFQTGPSLGIIPVGFLFLYFQSIDKAMLESIQIRTHS